MQQRVIDFFPPIIGTDAEFNTFRIGGFYAKHLSPGEEVFLLNGKDKIVFGRATVEKIDVGSLGDMLLIHAAQNHTELGNDPMTAPERLSKTISRLYGPHIAKLSKKTAVIYLKRTD